MQIIGMGIDYSTQSPLINSMDEQHFAEKILGSLHKHAEKIRNLSRASLTGITFRGEIEREHTRDLGNPRVAGWTFLVNGSDPEFSEIVNVLRPLAEHRGMAEAEFPLIYRDEPEDKWFDWLLENRFMLDRQTIPYYILIVGGPDQVPFRFQSLLSSTAAVGRVSFDSLDDLRIYVEKVIRLEKFASTITRQETVFFAPDAGLSDATYFSRHYMAEPIATHVGTKSGFKVRQIVGEEATKANLLDCLSNAKPALVYTASHGLGAPNEPLEIKKQLNGAICCQQTTRNEPIQHWLFTANDVPLDKPFIEGGIFFQFACFGYGTPAQSDFMHWLGNPQLNAEVDFVAALPKKLLAHSHGPIAFVGHLDTAWLHGFDDPDKPYILERWHPRIKPFVTAVETLLMVQPVGLAMKDFNERYNVTNALLTNDFDRLQKGEIIVTPDFRTRLAQAFITRSDAQNYMIFGDPAVRLRIAKG